MVEELSEFSAGEFQTVSELLASDAEMQWLMVILVVGLSIIASGYRIFGNWMNRKKFSYTPVSYTHLTLPTILLV